MKILESHRTTLQQNLLKSQTAVLFGINVLLILDWKCLK